MVAGSIAQCRTGIPAFQLSGTNHWLDSQLLFYFVVKISYAKLILSLTVRDFQTQTKTHYVFPHLDLLSVFCSLTKMTCVLRCISFNFFQASTKVTKVIFCFISSYFIIVLLCKIGCKI